MKNSSRNKAFIVATCAVLVACLLPFYSNFVPDNSIQSLELDSFDWRMRISTNFSASKAQNLATVYIDEDTITLLAEGYGLNFPYPRSVHGRLVRELNREGAKGIAFDILFTDLRVSDPVVNNADETQEGSDEFFARQIAESGNVVLPMGGEGPPAEIFEKAAMAIGSIAYEEDDDGVFRRVRPFVIDSMHDEGVRWHMGIIIAALELGIDLSTAQFKDDEIRFESESGSTIVLPLDRDGNLLIDWQISLNDEQVFSAFRYGPIVEFDIDRQVFGDAYVESKLQEYQEVSGKTFDIQTPFKDRIVLVGSLAEGNNVSDVGLTPLSKETPLVLTHLNVANMLVTNQFITQPGLLSEIFLVLLLGVLASLISIKTKATYAGLWILGITVLLILAGHFLFTGLKIWLPLATPVTGGLLLPYVSLVTFRLGFEESEQRRVKNVFKSIVSPNVVNELLNAENLSLGGARREITVFFADIRGFTQMTDAKQSRAETYVREHDLTGEQAEAYYDENSSEVLGTVNSYLALIADVIKKHDGTLDKYIGDCVMAFWGAPTPNEKHAVSCVRAAIDAQRAIYRFNQERFQQNERNKDLETEAEKLDLLSLGTGINSGMATVGLMGSKEHISNYTVFGGAVNLASRLEGLSGRSRIFIGEPTFKQLQKHDPELAATCVLQPPTTVKGIKAPITHYEVPWREKEAPVEKPVA